MRALLLAISLLSISPLLAEWNLPPVDLTPTNAANISASQPQVAINATGKGVAIWSQSAYDGMTFSDNRIQAATYDGTSWSSAQTLVATGTDASAFPQVGIDALGNAVAVWSVETAGTIIIQATTYANGSWTSPVTVTPGLTSGQEASQPAIAVDLAGNAVAVWAFFDGSDNIIQGASYNGSTWTTPVTVPDGGTPGLPNSPQIAVAPQGEAIAIWAQDNGSHYFIKAATLPFQGTTWTATPNLSTTGDNGGDEPNPQIAMDAAGNAVAVWEFYNGSNTIIQASTYNGSTWTTPENLTSPVDAQFPQVAVNASGHAAAIWQVNTGATYLIQAAILPFNTTTWIATSNLSSSGLFVAQSNPNPTIGIDATGNAAAIWEQYNGTNYTIQAANLPNTTLTWTTPTTLVTEVSHGTIFPTNEITPQLKVNSAGKTLAVWNIYNGTHEIIQALGGTVLGSLTGTVQTDNFFTQADVVVTLTWAQSQNNTVTAYIIYQGEIPVATVSSTGPFTYALHNQSPNRSYIYTVVAVNADGYVETTQSALIP